MEASPLDRLRESHLNIARRSAKYLEDVAAGMRVSLETGHVPARRKIIGAAVDLDRSLVALEVIGETEKICAEGGAGHG